MKKGGSKNKPNSGNTGGGQIKKTVSGPKSPTVPIMDKMSQNPIGAVFAAILALLLVLDFVVEKHETIAMGEIPEFYAMLGFAGAVGLVFGAKALLSVSKGVLKK
jgi:hypothetical protein